MHTEKEETGNSAFSFRRQRPPARLRDMPRVRFLSFGYGHGPRPTADLILDARHLTDPYLDPVLRELTARDPRVQRAVMRTPGAAAVVSVMVTATYALLATAAPDATVTIAVGCGGGRHRAPVLATRAAAQLDHLDDLQAAAVHRDIDEDLLPAGADDAAA
jgi:RNase adaptor protein for sRNA GlmZ degradation